jgi:hypothetical protein
MSDPLRPLQKPLDPSAEKAIRQLSSDLTDALLGEASRIAEGASINDDDLYQAYRRLCFPSKDSIQFADAQAVISQALRENRNLEWVSYGMAVTLFFFGLLLLALGAFKDDVGTRIGCLISGSIVQLLILIPFRFAINSRRHNIALRMLGMVINSVADPKKLSPLLRETFMAVILGSPRPKGGNQ